MVDRILKLGVMAVVCWVMLSAAHAQAEDSGEPAVLEGKELYISYGCAVCHGPSGDGRGLMPVQSKIPPTDFTDLKDYRFSSHKVGIQHSIKFGIKEEGSVMPSFEHIPEEELEKISEYLISLQKK